MMILSINKHTYLTILAILSVGLCSDLYAQKSILLGNLTPGKFEVGFKVINITDTSRIIKNNQKRPIQISMWYPGTKNKNLQKMLFKDYVGWTASEIDFSKTSQADKDKAVDDYAMKLISFGYDSSGVYKWLNSVTSARFNLIPIMEEFPLIIIAQGNFHSSFQQAILSEHLASYGYIVATSPSQTRIGGAITDTSQIFQHVYDQYKDMEFIYNQLKRRDDLHFNKLGLIGFSFGGRSAFLFINNNQFVHAFISLDSGIANKIGKNWIKNITVNNRIRIPILHFYEDVEEYIIPDFELLNSLRNSNRYLIKIEDMRHTQFFNIGMLTGIIDGFNLFDSNPKLVQEKFEAVCKYSKLFLDSILLNGNDSNFLMVIRDKSLLPNFFEVKILDGIIKKH